MLWMAESMAYVLAATVNGDLNLDSLYYKIMSFHNKTDVGVFATTKGTLLLLRMKHSFIVPQ